MIDPDDLPRNAPKKPKPLDNMSIEELTQGIADMKAEITRFEQEIARKKAYAAAASSIFKN